MVKNKEQYINRELSWLKFNARVLQEAQDPSVPLIERLRFVGIFSNNLDEFFKVRYATVKRIVEAGKIGKNQFGGKRADNLLKEITEVVIEQQAHSSEILKQIQLELEKEQIFILNETQLSDTQQEYVKTYFLEHISSALVTIVVKEELELPLLKDKPAYLAVKMELLEGNKLYALIEIPKSINRFIVLPEKDGKNFIILVDDVLRYCLDDVFQIFDYKSISAHMIKITRDGELDFDTDLSKSFMAKISESVKHRQIGHPVRFVYDSSIDQDTLEFFLTKMNIASRDSLIPGARYHNRRDYMKFPSLGKTELLYNSIKPLEVKGLDINKSLFKSISQKDYLVHTPYHTFSYVVKFLREAALDVKVRSIKITIYRLAQISHVASALINAAKNGKKVTVSIELQARFDEEANIKYANQMKDAGINLIFGVAGLKVHSKICVVDRFENDKIIRYGFVSTGNFNESTAKLYTDLTLLTSNQKILKDINKVFNFFEANYKIYTYKHIITSPHNTKNKFGALIDKEIENAKKGLPAYIKLKMNSMSNYDMVDKLYEASRAGVKIKLIVRGLCCLVPGIRGMSDNIEAISIIDKFLEHSRLYMFCNNNSPKVFISSADLMTRNIENRVEVTCPIYDEDIKSELQDLFEICWNDNVKARIINENQDNLYINDDNPPFRSQFEIYNYYLNQLEGNA